MVAASGEPNADSRAVLLSSAEVCRERLKVRQGLSKLEGLNELKLEALKVNPLGPLSAKKLPAAAKWMVAEPWDKLRGACFDVLVEENATRLKRTAALSRVQHWAPDCKTFSRALEKAVPGMPKGRGPRPLRSLKQPEGFSMEQLRAEFGESAEVIGKKLADHNAMAILAAEACIKAIEEGRYFIVENPAQSLLWHLPIYKKLAAMAGVRWTVFHNCALGGLRRKYSGVLSNIPEVHECMKGKLCKARDEEAPCDFTGERHLSWAATWKESGASVVTEAEAEYPQGMCEALAKAIAARVVSVPAGSAGTPFAFLEVYSGPNAPLTAAVKQALGVSGETAPSAEGRRCDQQGASPKGPATVLGGPAAEGRTLPPRAW